MRYLRKFNEGILGNMMGIERKGSPSRWYRYLGKANSVPWMENMDEIVSQKEPQYLPDEDIENITQILGDRISADVHRRHPEYSNYHPVQYPLLENIRNCRFGNCWFLKTEKDSHPIFENQWDICFQYYPDETYLVYVGDGNGRFFYNFECETFYGVQMFLREQILK